MDERPVGELVKAAGIVMLLDDDDLVADLVVIAKVVKSSGDTVVVKGTQPGTDWLTEKVMVDVIHEQLRGSYTDLEDT